MMQERKKSAEGSRVNLHNNPCTDNVSPWSTLQRTSSTSTAFLERVVRQEICRLSNPSEDTEARKDGRTAPKRGTRGVPGVQAPPVLFPRPFTEGL